MDQEKILKLIQADDWSPVLAFLHKHKQEISSDPLLQFTTHIFQAEFFKKLKTADKSISFTNLEELFLLHRGKFFVLDEQNYQAAVRTLAIRSKGKAALNYAQIFPEDEDCKAIIQAHNENNSRAESLTQPPKIEQLNWIEIYNRLFELINDKDDPKTYFSGPRFIDTLRKFHKYHPTYQQYIDLRNQEGKSTSRKIFYYDILMELDETNRVRFINEIIDTVEPFKKTYTPPIHALLNGAELSKPEHAFSSDQSTTRTVFISYSWDSENHKKWVLDLAGRLVESGINVLLDRYDLKTGKSLTHFVESSLAISDKIVIIFTPKYKVKASVRKGGVGYEYSIINAELYRNQTENDRIIPVLRAGSQLDSIPEFMHQYIHLDLRNDDNFERSLSDLKRDIWDDPEIVKPTLGQKN